jgi:hypothetical protein
MILLTTGIEINATETATLVGVDAIAIPEPAVYILAHDEDRFEIPLGVGDNLNPEDHV